MLLRLEDKRIAALAAGGIALSLAGGGRWPLFAVLGLGIPPLLAKLLGRLAAREAGADLLAGIAIAVSAAMGQLLVAAILVLMLSGGGALEQLATQRACFVLEALSRRMPRAAHRKTGSGIAEISIAEIKIGDALVVFPHEICPVDGEVVQGRGTMDESYLTGEPYLLSKVPGSQVLSGAVNGEEALTITATREAADSRHAGIMRVLEDSERSRPRLRRLADRLAVVYAPAALVLAGAAWAASGDAGRFLAVLVVATPCPLLIAVPVAVLGAISLSAGRGIIIRNAAVLEQIPSCSTVVLDKTGTLTYGKPSLTAVLPAPGFDGQETLRLAASLEKYSRHPLAGAVLGAASAAGLGLDPVTSVRETPGEGLRGEVRGREVRITGRKWASRQGVSPPEAGSGLECLVFIEGKFAAAFRFHDAPQPESRPFLAHLPSTHAVDKILLVSGDRESEVRYLAEDVGLTEVFAGKSPEEKLALVVSETRKAKTLFVGDGINDAPALLAATVGVAIGHKSDVTSEAAGAVVLSGSIGKVDELIHIGRHMRSVALQSAVGGMAASLLGMLAAASGHLPPLQGAVLQEIIDLVAVLNALRAAFPPERLTDF